MNMQQKCCFFFILLETGPIFPYLKRGGLFCEAKNNGFLFWDATRIMQNIQDVENSKKILSQRDEMMLTTIETNLLGS